MGVPEVHSFHKLRIRDAALTMMFKLRSLLKGVIRVLDYLRAKTVRVYYLCVGGEASPKRETGYFTAAIRY